METKIIEKWFENRQVLNKEQFEMLKIVYEFIQEGKVEKKESTVPKTESTSIMFNASNKTCYRCKRIKARTKFYINKKSRDGLQTYCKKCQKTVTREGKLRKKEKLAREALKKAREQVAQVQKEHTT